MNVNLRRRTLLQASGLGIAAPLLFPRTLAAGLLTEDAQPARPQLMLPRESRLFQLSPGLNYQLHDDVHANCLAFGPRGQRVIELLVERPVFGDTAPVAASVPDSAPALDGCDWLALIIDAADPQALADAGAAAQQLAQQDIYLRFALVLEGETPPEPAALVPLNQALGGVILLGQAAADPVQAAAPEVTAMALIEHFLIPTGLIGMDLADIRTMLRQGLGMHRAIDLSCLSSTLVDTLEQLASIESLEQAQAAMVWLASGLDFRIDELDAVLTTLANRAPEATYMVGSGVVPSLADGNRNLVLVCG